MKTPKRLAAMVEEGLVDEVIGQLMSGKEATVYVVRCGEHVRCAKVYKEANQRSFRNNASYQEGRKVKNSRQARAMEKGSRYGRKMQEEVWQSAEVDALYRLAAAGVRVPQPHICFEGVLLMDLVLDADGNAARGEVMFESSRNTLVHAGSRLVAAVGCEDMVVVETPDAVMVAHKDCTQDVKKVVARLKAEGRSLTQTHRKVYRPWGWYDSIDAGERFQVKRIVVNPGAKLSLQMHHHRAEHWIVVRGTAEVTSGDRTFLLAENESTYIPLGHTHRLANPGKVPLEIIEVQSGSYLGEDDIVRFEDTYGRVAPAALASTV